MTDTIHTTRRSFLKSGAWAAAPLAATSACVAALAGDDSPQRLSRLEAEAAIRSAQQSWLRQVNAGAGAGVAGLDTVHRIGAHHAGAPDRLDIAADGASATGHYDCAVELHRVLPRDSTLAQMAHAQGHGTVRRTERRMLSVEYRLTGTGWAVVGATLV